MLSGVRVVWLFELLAVMMMMMMRRASLRSPASGRRDSSHLGGLARDLGDIQRQHLAFAAASEVNDTIFGTTKLLNLLPGH